MKFFGGKKCNILLCSIKCTALFIILWPSLFLFSCNNNKTGKKYRIGFSQCANDVWRQNMQQEMEREISFHPEIEVITKNANLNSNKQIEQIKELFSEKIDLLIVSPNEAEPLTPIVDQVYNKGVPIIVVDRNILSKNFTAFIGANNYKVGQNAGNYTNAILKGKGNILEANGYLQGSSADIGRHDGFFDLVKNCSGLSIKGRCILDSGRGVWIDELSEYLKKDSNIDLVYCHDDRLALKVVRLCEKLGLSQKIKIIGIDGLPGKDNGIELVASGALQATILYPNGGKEAIQTAIDILEHRPYQKENELSSIIVDSTNVRIMRLQNDKVLAQQADIDKRQQRIENLDVITKNQSHIILTISSLLILSLILGSILFFYLRENRKINKRLALQNDEIVTQRNQLIELGKKAQVANEAKISFFTNISHEFKTPLTLILGPLKELIANQKITFKDKGYLSLIQKNVIRLLRLVNQLIDFRRIEVDKMKLSVSENDLVLFTTEIVEAFKGIAKKRNIDIRIFNKEREMLVWFDKSMLDKVLFNLLSNALKFTNDGGYIYLSLEKNRMPDTVTIKVEDNGIGMSEDVANHAFELFYQANITSQQGSGLGLSLSKELIQLHKGEIKVSSKQGKGTAFEITLLLGTGHLKKEEMMYENIPENSMYFDQKIYSTELYETIATNEENNLTDTPELSVLIIEDNADLNSFLADILQNEYVVLSAKDGLTGLKEAFENIPDLIVSDIVLPGKDGLYIAKTLKNDIKTSHIPIILLTAKTEINQQIEGMKNMVDAYITKPFNVEFLKETIKSLMKNRAILREHYTSEIYNDAVSQTANRLDRKFINEFTSIVENNLSNEAFNVDEIAKQMHISRVQLYRKVKALLDCNINDHILNVRLQKSKYLLTQSEFTIGEIAYKVGFATPAYFSTVFKNKMGTTPSEFRSKK